MLYALVELLFQIYKAEWLKSYKAFCEGLKYIVSDF